jgi:hypothetical protein
MVARQKKEEKQNEQEAGNVVSGQSHGILGDVQWLRSGHTTRT